jgi:hypothetical protein
LQYAGDSSFTINTSSTFTQNVNQASTTTGLTSSANPSVSGQGVTFTATVAAVSPGAGTPTGNVTFYDGATVLGSGTLNGGDIATYTTSALSTTSHSITAVYVGDTNFATGTSSVVTQLVNQDGSTTAVTSSANPSSFGQTVTYTATVAANSPGSGTPTGTVTFHDGGSNVSGCVALTVSSGSITCVQTYNSLAAHNVTVVYAGDANFVMSTSSNLTQTVVRDTVAITVTSSPNPAVPNQPVIFTATIAPSHGSAIKPTGTANFYDGNTLLGTAMVDPGTAILTINSLSVGTHDITVSYSGDANYAAGSTSTGAADIQQVVVPVSVPPTGLRGLLGWVWVFGLLLVLGGCLLITGRLTFFSRRR